MKVIGDVYSEKEKINPTITIVNNQKLQKRIKSLGREQINVVREFLESPVRDKQVIDRDQIIIAKNYLNKAHPNFHEVTEAIFDNLLLSTLSPTKGISFQPILILGEAGIGKTFYCKSLANLLDLPKLDIDFSTTTSGFVLSGTSSKWGNSSVGAICRMLMTETVANGLVVIDEVDKSGDSPGMGGNPINTLLTLLEKHSAQDFKDEFLDVPIDASHLNYIATANDISHLPPQILSRFTVIKVEVPNFDEMLAITDYAYGAILREMEIEDVFEDTLSYACIEAISEQGNVRNLKKKITNAIISAVKNHRFYVELSDIDVSDKQKQTGSSIGFLATL
jgi:ATP-dependent Lon protease